MNPVSAVTRLLLVASSFAGLAVLGSCRQVPSPPAEADAPGAQFVDVGALANGDTYSGVPVLTVVPLRHITAADAEVRLQATLPEGVRLGRVGDKTQLLVQGPGQAVAAAIQQLQRLDVR